jgi:predicted dehydrogenase
MTAVGNDVIATVDLVHPEAQYRSVEEMSPKLYDAALVCTPDGAKLGILRHLLGHGKHALVEKPLIGNGHEDLLELQTMARLNSATLYTAYNHRFEPHIASLKQLVDSGRLGKLYSARFFYGNGTARDVRNSPWRDQGFGVLPDLGVHLLDMILFLFGGVEGHCRAWRADRFENRAYDHVVFGFHGPLAIDCEISMVSWRNTFHTDVYGELGSVHIDGLCKWGPSTLTIRDRIFPSGRPDEESRTLVCADPTWRREFDYFKSRCGSAFTNIENDIWIESKLREMTSCLV